MKLIQLYKENVLRDYLVNLKKLYKSTLNEHRILSESKITITIDDTDDKKKSGISVEAKEDFLEKAKALGNFDNADWVNQLLRSMKQAGVQGFNEICEDDRPATSKQIRQLITMLVDLVSK